MHKLTEYNKLLETYNSEQDLQLFLEKNTEFIPREFVQNHGIHNRLLFRKLKLAENYTTDFFYLSKSSDDWNCIFIEIEKPKSKFFKNGSNEIHPDFLIGLDQIDRWRAWLDSSTNKEYLINEALSFIRQPLQRNPCHIKFVLVTGRREEYQGSDLRRSLIRAKERDDFKIITFDSLAEDYKQHTPLYLCVKKNEYFEIHSEKLLSENVFDWTGAEHIRLNPILKDELINTTKTSILNSISSDNPVSKLNAELSKKKLEKWNHIKTI